MAKCALFTIEDLVIFVFLKIQFQFKNSHHNYFHGTGQANCKINIDKESRIAKESLKHKNQARDFPQKISRIIFKLLKLRWCMINRRLDKWTNIIEWRT